MKNDSQRVRWRSLVRKREFQKVYEQGAKRVGRLVVVYLLAPDGKEIPAPAPDFARAVVASKKVGNAVARNRAKRLMREAHRLGTLGQLGMAGDRDQLRRECERLLWEPCGQEAAAGQSPNNPCAVPKAVEATEMNSFAGMWVVLVARHRILNASSREVREELDTLLRDKPQLQ